jgi:hypothetical protein
MTLLLAPPQPLLLGLRLAPLPLLCLRLLSNLRPLLRIHLLARLPLFLPLTMLLLRLLTSTSPKQHRLMPPQVFVCQLPHLTLLSLLLRLVAQTDGTVFQLAAKSASLTPGVSHIAFPPPPYSPNHRSNISSHVVGVSGACYSRFNSQAEAENSYRTAFTNRAVRIVNSS